MSPYPKVLYVGTHEFLQTFLHTTAHLRLSKSNVEEILQQIVIVMLDQFSTFRFSLAQLPNFMPLYPNAALIMQDNKELLAIATHRLGLDIYNHLESLGAFIPHQTCGGLGFFPYYLKQVSGGDITLVYIDDTVNC